MTEFTIGQRWYSTSEPHLGLGIVTEVQPRQVSLHFPDSEERRVYAIESAVLFRMILPIGETAHSRTGWFLWIEQVIHSKGLVTYSGPNDSGVHSLLPESELISQIRLNQPLERIVQGDCEADKWFVFRYHSLKTLNRISHSPVRGLTGARAQLLPHQLYIAHEVSSRFAPRVLLADEVGLGKTIEAGLVIHKQLLTDQARRILIVVPETLLHQWLVEMQRKFNLSFSLFDAERCEAEAVDAADGNPFYGEQLILCSLQFLLSHPQRAEQANAAAWDLLIVDEAHHLYWSEQAVSTEYKLIEALAGQTRGIILLTGTPEQSGTQGHFARLRLLDPQRFPDLKSFIKEEEGYQPFAALIDKLLEQQPLATNERELLQSTIAEGDNDLLIRAFDQASADNAAAVHELVNHLLDRHGTSRVLFRNTRAHIKGFPQRKHHPYPLPCPKPYQVPSTANTTPRWVELLSPETEYRQRQDSPAWTEIDPRLNWLFDLLTSLRPEKVLVITATKKTVWDIAEKLKRSGGLRIATFHEDMSIVERDRAAAYFALQEQGAQALICSEIGSEGRNFQFAHHLVLFDLPPDPDLLEQRIGRLDRIGQTQDIQIHVPVLTASALDLLHRWYHEGLNAFTQPCPAAHASYQHFADQLFALACQPSHDRKPEDGLISEAKQLTEALNKTLEDGRDHLLELNSFRPVIANRIVNLCKAEDKSADLHGFMTEFYEYIGLETEIHSRHSVVVKPGDHMRVTQFPGLPEDGMVITYQRDAALANEDWQFLTWDHPFVQAALDYVLTNQVGATAITAIKQPGFKPGQLLMETIALLEPSGAFAMHAGRYLPATSIRVVTNINGTDLAEQLPHRIISKADITVTAEMAKQIGIGHAAEIRRLAKHCLTLTNTLLPSIKATALQQLETELQSEINRLIALGKNNPNIRPQEIAHLRERLDNAQKIIGSATARIDAIRLLVTT